VRLLVWLAGLTAALAAAGASGAEQARLLVDDPPYYTGVPLRIVVQADGFDESPEPDIEAPAIKGARLEFRGQSPSVSSNVQIVNGKVSQWKRVRFRYRYDLIPEEPGSVSIPAFRITQGSRRTATVARTLTVGAVPKTDSYRIRVRVPERALWVGERVRIRIEWWIAEDAASRISKRRARIPLFDHPEAFRFEGTSPAARRNALVVDTVSGPVQLFGTVRRETESGTRYLVVQFERTLIPLRPISLVLPPSSVVVEEVSRYTVNLFGDRVPARTRKVRAIDRPRTVTVRAPPAEGRPDTFAGAVGEGFAFSVAADRTVVKTGDPIRLTLTVRGTGVLETVSLPPLEAAGLDPSSFGLPGEPPAGTVEGDRKRFTVTVRIKNDDVREIPPLALSWFDPKHGRYETARSRPIALSVHPSRVVSASEVVRRPAPDGGTAKPKQGPVAPGPSAAPSRASLERADVRATRRPVFTLGAAELALVRDPKRLLGRASRRVSPVWVPTICYGGGVLLLGLAGWRRHLRNRDPARVRSENALRALRRAVEAATTAAELAAALRRYPAPGELELDPAERVERDRLVGRCDELAFAPESAKQRSATENDTLAPLLAAGADWVTRLERARR